MPSWNDRLTQAEERGHFTADDDMDSGLWECCAIGEHFPTASDVYGLLTTEEIHLGTLFSAYIADDDVKGARECYEAIQHHFPIKLTS
jgi:hypothetical protein